LFFDHLHLTGKLEEQAAEHSIKVAFNTMDFIAG
jgi:hypothetical protein